MLDRIKQIPSRVLEFWNKYSKKQKVIFISVIGAVFLSMAILVFILGRTEFVELMKFSDTKTAKQAVDILKTEGISYQLGSDNLTVLVDDKKRSEAVLALADSEIANDEKFSMEQLLDNDMSTTNSDKQLKLHLYYQSYVEELLKRQEGIDEASVSYLPTDTRTSILETQKDIGCSVFLTVNDKFKASSAEAIAVVVANGIGNKSTENIKIIDQYGNLLYNGPSDEEEQYANKNLEYKKVVNDYYYDRVVRFALMNGYNYVEPIFNLDINMDQESVVYKEYIAAEGQEQGLYSTFETYSSENKGTSGDVTGTDANDEVDYYIQDSGSGDSSEESKKITYLPSEKTTNTMKEWGVINTSTSTMSIVLKTVKQQTEKDLETLGLLEDTSFDEYVLNHSDPVQVEVNEELYTLFANATGIDASNISIIIWEVPSFIPNEPSASNWSLYLQIILAVIIVGLLVFVVFRSMAPVEVTEIEPELSVEQLLATTKENQSLDDIEFSEKSETRRMIDKFVDENPEAVAQLLRNWLNEDWD